MRTEEFDYSLPPELIAQHPAGERTASRLLVLDRQSGTVGHRRFSGITDCLRAGDLIVLNETKVMPARLTGTKETGGAVDILLTGKVEAKKWSLPRLRLEARSAESARGRDPTRARAGSSRMDRRVPNGTCAEDLMGAFGRMPLPRYIKRAKDAGRNGDEARYQTVYARKVGSIAAPTAGLHFDEALLGQIEAMGVGIARITLHIGTGTFFLIKSADVEDHAMHSERYCLSPDVIEAVERTKKAGGRVIAVGTSAVRQLRDCVRAGKRRDGRGDGPFHLSGLPLPGSRCPDNQFSPLPLHAAYARLCLCGQRGDRRSIQGGRRARLPVLQLR